MSYRKNLVAKISAYNGVPTLFVNGKPNAAIAYMTYEPSFAYVKDFSSARIQIISFSTTSDHSYFNFAPDSWIAPGRYDYTDFDDRIRRILHQAPNAYLLPRVYICTPKWWNEAHPEEMSKGHMIGPMESQYGSFPSVSSRSWKKASGDALRRLIEYAENQAYGERIIGYHLASAGTEEWYYFDYWDDVTGDFSAPQKQAFIRWLRERYKTVKELRQQWGDAKITFDSVSVPIRAERMDTDWGEFRNVIGRDRRVADYCEFHNDAMADAAMYFSKIAKKACKGNKITGIFYGYLMEMSGGGMGVAESGVAALNKILKCNDIDFLAAPSSYSFRESGEGASLFMAPVASVKQHGKLWFDENDYRTHRVLLKDKHAGWHPTKDLQETIHVQLRELSQVIAEGTGMWWFDMKGGWFDEPRLMAAIEKMNNIAERSIFFDRSSVAEIAVVVDEASMCYLRPGVQLSKPLISDQRLELARLGAPVDYVLLSDLSKARPYKMYVFLNAFRLNKRTVATIKRITRRNNCLSLWVMAPGLLRENVVGNNIEKLTGIRVKVCHSLGPLDFVVDPETSLTRAGCPAWTKGGIGGLQVPMLKPDEPEAEILAWSPINGNSAIAMRRFESWISVYSAAPLLPSAVLRALARIAGVHIYLDSDEPLYANRSFLGMHGRKGGKKHLRFSSKTALYDVFNQKTASKSTSSVNISLRSGDSILFFLGTESQWKKSRHI